MLAKRRSGEAGLRIGVKAGGCSGFEYIFGWERAAKDTDAVFEGPDGAKVFVDRAACGCSTGVCSTTTRVY
jgi:Uncharacterized conserved protein